MVVLLTGLALLLALSLFTIFWPQSRAKLMLIMGAAPYKMLYAGLSTLGLVLLCFGYTVVSNGPPATDFVYLPPSSMRHATMSLVLLAFLALAAVIGKNHIKLWLRYPLYIALVLWSAGHLLSNGRLYDIYMFGTFLLIGVAGISVSLARGARPNFQPTIKADIIMLVVGLGLYMLFLFGFHPYILHIPVLSQ